MCRRKTTAMQTIEAMCASHDMKIDDLTAKSKLLLKSYRRVCWASLGSFQLRNDDGYCICSEDIDKALDYLYSYSPHEELGIFEQNLKKLFDSRWMVELVDDTMVQVKEFPDSGVLYLEILQKCFLNKYKYTEAELLEILKIERSRFYDRKKEAILAFGLALWGTVLPRIATIMESESGFECPD